MIKIWVDDERPMPDNEYFNYHATSVYEVIMNLCIHIGSCAANNIPFDVYLDLDHDAGIETTNGGDYINILKALSSYNTRLPYEAKKRACIKVHFHSANPVGVKNMRAIVESCPWMEEV